MMCAANALNCRSDALGGPIASPVSPRWTMFNRMLSAGFALVVVLYPTLHVRGFADPVASGKASLSGIVVDEAGRPVPKASVWLRDSQRRALLARQATDAAGKFSFEAVAAESVTFAVV